MKPQLIIAVALVPFLGGVAQAADFPTEQQMRGIVFGCGGGISDRMKGEVQGRIDLWRKAAEATASGSKDLLSGILSITPTGQQISEANYKTFTQCILEAIDRALGVKKPRDLVEMDWKYPRSQRVTYSRELRPDVVDEKPCFRLPPRAEPIEGKTSIVLVKARETVPGGEQADPSEDPAAFANRNPAGVRSQWFDIRQDLEKNPYYVVCAHITHDGSANKGEDAGTRTISSFLPAGKILLPRP